MLKLKHCLPVTDVSRTARWPSSHDGFLEVYVSAVEHPGHFWVQILNAKSLQLETLNQEMTAYYDKEEVNQVTHYFGLRIQNYIGRRTYAGIYLFHGRQPQPQHDC